MKKRGNERWVEGEGRAESEFRELSSSQKKQLKKNEKGVRDEGASEFILNGLSLGVKKLPKKWRITRSVPVGGKVE